MQLDEIQVIARTLIRTMLRCVRQVGSVFQLDGKTRQSDVHVSHHLADLRPKHWHDLIELLDSIALNLRVAVGQERDETRWFQNGQRSATAIAPANRATLRTSTALSVHHFAVEWITANSM